jgi:hypothetical protein
MVIHYSIELYRNYLKGLKEELLPGEPSPIVPAIIGQVVAAGQDRAGSLPRRYHVGLRRSSVRNIRRPRPNATPITLGTQTEPDDNELASDKGQKHPERLIHEAVRMEADSEHN